MDQIVIRQTEEGWFALLKGSKLNAEGESPSEALEELLLLIEEKEEQKEIFRRRYEDDREDDLLEEMSEEEISKFFISE